MPFRDAMEPCSYLHAGALLVASPSCKKMHSNPGVHVAAQPAYAGPGKVTGMQSSLTGFNQTNNDSDTIPAAVARQIFEPQPELFGEDTCEVGAFLPAAYPLSLYSGGAVDQFQRSIHSIKGNDKKQCVPSQTMP